MSTTRTLSATDGTRRTGTADQAPGTAPVSAPIPFEGAKRGAVAEMLWGLLGADAPRYVEPFCGSLSVLLARPGGARGHETVNDLDALLSNAWRAVRYAPADVARHVDPGVSEIDLEARHLWLVERADLIRRGLALDPTWFDAQAAGWWLWGRCAWLAGGWCTGRGTWTREAVERGERARRSPTPGITRKVPVLNSPRGLLRDVDVVGWLGEVSARLARVTITCGDWERVLTPSIMRNERVSILLDPPYDSSNAHRQYGARCSDFAVVAARAIELGMRPTARVVLCGHRTDGLSALFAAAGWAEHPLPTPKGYMRTEADEVAWSSPACAPDTLKERRKRSDR